MTAEREGEGIRQAFLKGVSKAMKLLLYAGFLYLIGVAILLVLQPSIMFRDNGVWKEFGIGRDTERYTWMPFWLFSILWAMMSYMFVLIAAGSGVLPGVSVVQEVPTEDLTVRQRKKLFGKEGTRPGYYIINSEATATSGIPKYIYLGPQPPNLIYNNAPVDSANE